MLQVQKCLDDCQKTFTSHPQRVNYVRSHYETPLAFLKLLTKYLKKLLFVQKSSLPLKRLFSFVSRIATSPSDDEKAKIWVDGYVSALIKFCLRYVASPVKSVRTRSLDLIATVLNELPENFSLNEAVFESLNEVVYPLLKDGSPSTRIQSVLALSRLQVPQDPKDKITRRFLKLMTNDPNKNVREECLKNIGIVKQTLPHVLTRIRDVSEHVRKTTFAVIKEKIDIRSLSILQRNKVLFSGLQDRVAVVREECSDMLLNFWLPSCGSLINFLKLLDVEENEQEASLIVSHVLEKINVIDDESMPPFVDSLSNEKAFLWKSLSFHINNKKPIDWSYLDKIMIDTPKFVSLLENYRSDNFIFQQLLFVCKHLDYKDEANRLIIIDKTKNFLTDLNLPNEFVSPILEILRSVYNSEKVFAKQLIQTILTLLVGVENNENEKGLTIEKKLEIETLVYTRVLDIIKDMFKYSRIGLAIPDIVFLKEKIILVCVTKNNPFIRAPALEALALYCYFDSKEAEKYIVLMFHVLKNDQEAIQLIAMKSIIDMLLIHRDLTKIQIENSESGDSGPSSLIDALSSYLGSDDERMMYTAVEGFSKLLTLGRVRTVKPLSMCILLLFNPNSGDEEPIQQCLSLFFSSFLYLSGKNFVGNAGLFAKAFLPTMKIILHAPASSPLSKISVERFSRWVFSYFPTSHMVLDDHQIKAFEKNKAFISQTRESLVITLLEEILSNNLESEAEKNEIMNISKTLSSITLCSLHTYSLEANKMKAVQLAEEALEKLDGAQVDKFARYYLKRFLRALHSDECVKTQMETPIIKIDGRED